MDLFINDTKPRGGCGTQVMRVKVMQVKVKVMQMKVKVMKEGARGCECDDAATHWQGHDGRARSLNIVQKTTVRYTVRRRKNN